MIKSDWHIHTKNSCDCPDGISMEKLVRQALGRGVTDFGVSDHVHTYLNYPSELKKSREEFERLMEKYPDLKGRFHFGVEVSSVSEWEIDVLMNGKVAEEDKQYAPYTYGLRRSNGPRYGESCFPVNAEIIAGYNIEYVIGGVHWAMFPDDDSKRASEDLHKQYMKALAHPHIDILAHWLWWAAANPGENEFADFKKIPAYMKDEIAWGLKRYDKVFEINNLFKDNYEGRLAPDFTRLYLEYAAALQDSGVTLSFGSDFHGNDYSSTVYIDEVLFKECGIDTDKFFCLPRKKVKVKSG